MRPVLAAAALLSMAGCQFRPAGAANQPGASDGSVGAGSFDAAAGGGADASLPLDAPDAGPRAVGLIPTGVGTALGSLGGNGGTPFIADCPDHRVVTGLDATDNDSGLSQGRAICSRVVIAGDDSVSLTDPATTGSYGFENAHPLAPVMCPAGQVVVGYDGSDTNYVRRIRPYCAPLTWNGTAYTVGSGQAAADLGTSTGQDRGPFACSDGQVAAGFQGRAGSLLDNFELRCSALTPVTN